MANFTPQQLQQMNSMLAGTFDKLDTAPKSQPGYTMDQIYGGILPKAPAAAQAKGATTYYPTDGSYTYGPGGAYEPKTSGVAYPASGYKPPTVPGQSDLTFGAANPLQAQYPAVAPPYASAYGGGGRPLPPLSPARQPVNLTVRGAGMDDLGSGTSWAEVQRMLMQQGADPGMQGLPGFGNTPMSPGIPAQLPPADGSVGLPKWKGAAVAAPPTTFAGSSTGKQYNIGQTYSSGGYMFEMTPNGPKQVGRDPKGVIPQTYQGTPQAAAAAAARERLTGGDGMDRSAAGDSFTGPYGTDTSNRTWSPTKPFAQMSPAELARWNSQYDENGRKRPKVNAWDTAPSSTPGTGSTAPRFRR